MIKYFLIFISASTTLFSYEQGYLGDFMESDGRGLTPINQDIKVADKGDKLSYVNVKFAKAVNKRIHSPDDITIFKKTEIETY